MPATFGECPRCPPARRQPLPQLVLFRLQLAQSRHEWTAVAATLDASGEGAEDAADDLGLHLVDGALAVDRFALGIGVCFTTSWSRAAAGFAFLQPASDTTMGLAARSFKNSAFIVTLRPL